MSILLATSSDLLRGALASAMAAAHPDIPVIEAASLEEATAILDSGMAVRLAIVDHALIGWSGLQGLDSLQASAPGLRVAVLSGPARRLHALAAYSRGAVGFLPKDAGIKALLGAVEVMLAGGTYVPALVVEQPRKAALPRTDISYGEPPRPRLASLTRRETDVLTELTRGHANKDIAQSLGMKPITVASHLKRVFKKLGAHNRTHAATIALQAGL